tara:strand:- start:3103 stop:3333 length:231 start_codon:yes stop_codon:yes gene_type:complete
MYKITLDKKEIMQLIEMLESHRCEGEDKSLAALRHKIKNLFQEQFIAEEKISNYSEQDVLNAAKAAMGPTHCDSCD